MKERLAWKVAEGALQRDFYRGLGEESKKKTSFPRDGDAENPWHIIDFSKFMEYAASRPKFNPNRPFPSVVKNKVGYIQDKHFAPYYSQKPLSPCNIQYDVIIKQEFLGDELGLRLQNLMIAKLYSVSKCKNTFVKP